MEQRYPIGAQYFSTVGKGTLAGMANDLIAVNTQRQHKDGIIAVIKAGAAVSARKYRGSVYEALPKRITMAMTDIIAYVKKHPGTRRSDLLLKKLGGDTVSPSCLGSSLKKLVDMGILETDCLIKKRRFYVKEKNK